mgnify:CR=1 FL=1
MLQVELQRVTITLLLVTLLDVLLLVLKTLQLVIYQHGNHNNFYRLNILHQAQQILLVVVLIDYKQLYAHYL